MKPTAPCRKCGRSLFCDPPTAKPICNPCLRVEAPEMSRKSAHPVATDESPPPCASCGCTMPTTGILPPTSTRCWRCHDTRYGGPGNSRRGHVEP